MTNQTTIPYKIYLEEHEMPKQWYNVRADMKNKPAPLLNPETFEPMTAEELSKVFCDELVKQELDDTTAYFDIQEDILNFYKIAVDSFQAASTYIDCSTVISGVVNKSTIIQISAIVL